MRVYMLGIVIILVLPQVGWCQGESKEEKPPSFQLIPASETSTPEFQKVVELNGKKFFLSVINPIYADDFSGATIGKGIECTYATISLRASGKKKLEIAARKFVHLVILLDGVAVSAHPLISVSGKFENGVAISFSDQRIAESVVRAIQKNVEKKGEQIDRQDMCHGTQK